MEWYLNYIYLGEGCNGVATAARNYFDKDLSELTLAECASLIDVYKRQGKLASLCLTLEEGFCASSHRKNAHKKRALFHRCIKSITCLLYTSRCV